MVKRYWKDLAISKETRLTRPCFGLGMFRDTGGFISKERHPRLPAQMYFTLHRAVLKSLMNGTNGKTFVLSLKPIEKVRGKDSRDF